jgi:hypothetical protein
MTLPTALAAPVDAGMMFWPAPRPERQSLPEGASTVFWVAVVAWQVVIRPSTMPKLGGGSVTQIWQQCQKQAVTAVSASAVTEASSDRNSSSGSKIAMFQSA